MGKYLDSSGLSHLMSLIKTAIASSGGSGASVPVGTIQMYGGSTAPSGWLLCDGSAINRTTYASLYSVISTTYGSGDGSTTFNVPDLRGRTAVGAGTGVYPGTSTNLTARSLGDMNGHEALQSHNHNAASNGYTVPGKDGGWNWRQTNSGTSTNYKNTPMGGSSAAVASIDKTGSTGGGNAGNMQPFTVVNYIIYAGS